MSYVKGKRVALSDEPTEESIAFAEYCRELLDYRDGSLVWKISRGRIKAGDVAGRVNNKEYLQVNIDRVSYLLHQIVFLIHHNYIPKTIDHIDRNKVNNSIKNLRSVTTRENMLNRIDNTETPNISKNGGSFQVMFMFKGKKEYFGIYNTIEEAIVVRDKIANDLDNWKSYIPIKSKDKSNRYISKHGKGFRLQKTINGSLKYFGIYKTLEEAIAARDELEANNWIISD